MRGGRTVETPAAPFQSQVPSHARRPGEGPGRTVTSVMVPPHLAAQYHSSRNDGSVLTEMFAQFAAVPGGSYRGRTEGDHRVGESKVHLPFDAWGAWKWRSEGARITKAQPYSRGPTQNAPQKQKGPGNTTKNPDHGVSTIQAAGPRQAAQKHAGGTTDTETQRKRGECHAPNGDAGDGPGSGEVRELGTTLSEATKLAENHSWREKSRLAFTKKFYTPGTLAAKNTKRKRVGEIMEALETTFPLGTADLVTIASVLDAAGLKAGDQYLAEAKAMHVEAGNSWSDVLEAHMGLCKRALRRGKGPECRAKEVRIQDIPDGKWELCTVAAKNPRRVAWSYAWATMWMLRSAEAAEVKVGHVTLDGGGKRVRLNIPKSKTDQGAVGTSRTLGCCGLEACSKECPVALAVRALAEQPNADPEDPLFPDYEGNPVTKIQLVTSWTKHLDEHMTGHSARRSGAMMYTRAGVDIQTVGFLGRWKSSAVFRYVEEAMKEMPLNKQNQVVLGTRQSEGRGPDKENPGSKVDTCLQVTPNQPEPPTEGKDLQLWAVSRSRDKLTIHKVKEASWNIPLNEWKTVCGWHFARHNVKVELTRCPSASASLCCKCDRLGEMRDEVSWAREWAHQLQL